MPYYGLTQLPPPDVAPTSALGVTYSPDGTLLAVSSNATPWLELYSVGSDGALVKASNPAVIPNGYTAGPSDIAFSPNGAMLARCQVNSPYLAVYDVAGATLTKRTVTLSPALSGAPPTGLAFSPNGGHLAITTGTSPFVAVYAVSAGSTWTRLTLPVTPPAGAAKDVAYSPNGALLAVVHNNTPFISFYSISGTTYTKTANPTVLPPTGCFPRAVTFSPDSTMCVMSHDAATMITAYTVAGTTFTSFNFNARVAVAGSGANTPVRFTNDGQLFVYSLIVKPYVAVCAVSGTTFAGQADPPIDAAALNSSPVSISFTPDSRFMALGVNGNLLTYRVETLTTAPTPAFLWG